MKKGFPTALAAFGVAIALAACTGSSEPPPPTPDELARAVYDRIATEATALLMSDQLGYFGSDDEVERTSVRCRDDTCLAGFVNLSQPRYFSVEGNELELLGKRRGVSQVVERASGEHGDVHVYGGWLEHSLFATQSDLLTVEINPDRGATVVQSYSLGFSTGENPSAADGSARWQGLMIGRDMRAAASRGHVVRGDADVTVEFGAGALTVDVEFSGIANLESGEAHSDMEWRGVTLKGGGFARHNAPDDTISGRFYGPSEQEVGGVFERDGIAGAFGGTRSTP